MKKIIGALIPLLLLGTACKKDLTSLNVDPKSPQSVPSASLFTNAQRLTASTLASANVNLNIFRLVEQQWQETTYADESNYDIRTRAIPDGVWNRFYRDILNNFELAKSAAAKDVTDATVQKNDIAIVDLLEVYDWFYLVTTFGNIPYSQALKITTTDFPKYDDQKTVYYDLLARLDADVAALSTSSTSWGSADIIYSGDVTQWKKFANSLKLKMGIVIADYDNTKAKTVVESAVASGVFTSNSDNALFKFLSAPPNTNPIWVDLVQSGRQDFVANRTFISGNNTAANGGGSFPGLESLNDPRLPLYFTTDNKGSYSGGAPGANSNYATFSKPTTTITSPSYPGDMLDYAETEFNLAEAVERGYTVGGDAATHYNNGVTASITFWGGSATTASTYLAQSSVAYATATGNYKQKIGTQKYIAFYNRGWDAWIDTRRLDYPVLIAPSTALSAFPLRFPYPVNEQNTNPTNYAEAAAAIGGDVVTTKLFFDVK